MSEQGEEDVGSVASSTSSARRRAREDELRNRIDQLQSEMQEMRSFIRETMQPQASGGARVPDIGEFATPEEGSVQGEVPPAIEPVEAADAGATASSATVEAALARHTVGFVAPPVVPVTLLPAATAPIRGARLELPSSPPDLSAASSDTSDPIPLGGSLEPLPLTGYALRFSTAPARAA